MSRRRSTEPACRICGCTEHNARDEGCSWVRVPKGEKPLCSACAGTAADLFQVMTETRRLLGNLVPFSVDPRHTIGVMRSAMTAAIARRRARERAEANVIDASWGSR